MTKKPSPGDPPKSRPDVVHSDGRRQPFLRGMVTHDLVQRGLSFDDSYAIARALTDQLAGRAEVSTQELRDAIDREIEQNVDEKTLAGLRPSGTPSDDLQITYAGDAQPFSRGLLAQSLYAAGLDFDRAYALVLEIQRELKEDGTTRIDARDLALAVADTLERFEGRKVARRYRLVRQIQQLPKPLVLYIAGASGTGKSTLALDLAPLLRIYSINATDTIRQVMRMVFSPAILPALHRSSFEADVQTDTTSDLPSDPQERHNHVIRNFEQQATKVCVGVRAVVERSLAEGMSVLIEGVHLLPSIVPFSDLDSLAYQEMFILTTLDEEVHRSHFLSRQNLADRQPARYLQHFEAIRSQQKYLLQQAEDYDLPLVDTSERDVLVPQSLRLITDLLQRRLPFLAESPESQARPARSLLLVIDGLGDHPNRSLGGRTPLQVAETPTFDRLAREGLTGLADPVAVGVVPDTASGNLAVFGQSPQSMSRGPIEAIGTGLELEVGDVALRANFATADEEGRVIDRRAGRIRRGTAELADALNAIEMPEEFSDIQILVKQGTEHRLAVVLRGVDLSPQIEGSDPGDAATPGVPLIAKATDPSDVGAVRTAAALAAFEELAAACLENHPVNQERRQKGKYPANIILTRGAGRLYPLTPLSPAGFALELACISGDRTVQGIATLLGARSFHEEGMTANLDTDLKRKFQLAKQQLRKRDLVVLHVKGADIAAHDRRADKKVAFLEAVDAALGKLLAKGRTPFRVAIAADHTTVSETGQHAADPVPVVIWGPGVPTDSVTEFDERSVSSGGLGRFSLQVLIDKIFTSSEVLATELASLDQRS